MKKNWLLTVYIGDEIQPNYIRGLFHTKKWEVFQV